MRLDRDAYKRNLDGFLKKEEQNKAKGLPGKPEQEAKLRKMHEDAIAQYEKELVELTSAIQFSNTEAEAHDDLGLIWTEVQAFRAAQFQYFVTCQKASKTRGDEGEVAIDSTKTYNNKNPIMAANSSSNVQQSAPILPPPKPPKESQPLLSSNSSSDETGDDPSSLSISVQVPASPSPPKAPLPPPPPPSIPSPVAASEDEADRKNETSKTDEKEGKEDLPTSTTTDDFSVRAAGSFTLKAPVSKLRSSSGDDDEDEEDANHGNALQMALRRATMKKTS